MKEIQHRFNHDCKSNSEALVYIENRSKQLLRLGYYLKEVIESEWGLSVFYEKEGKLYQSIYILDGFRNKGIYKKVISNTILTSIECNISDYLHKNNINCVVENLSPFIEYDIISEHYKNDKAKRSQVPFMNHIDEGLAILEWIGASENAKKAYCLHPIYQSDSDLLNVFEKRKDINSKVSPDVLLLAMEYRNIANSYLSTRQIEDISEINLSPIKDVNDMLIADKIQNRKDFELFHLGTHHRSKSLIHYFNNWMKRLDISENKYQEYKKRLCVFGK